jgi:hypothetical protein
MKVYLGVVVDGVVAEAGLGVDHGDEVELFERGVGDVSHGGAEVFEHGSVFGASDDSAVGDDGVAVGEFLEQEFERAGAGDGVGVGVVLEQDERALSALEEPAERGEPLACRWPSGHRSFLLDGLDGALGDAGAALRALLLVDYGLAIDHGDGFDGAHGHADFTADTFVRIHLHHVVRTS